MNRAFILSMICLALCVNNITAQTCPCNNQRQSFENTNSVITEEDMEYRAKEMVNRLHNAMKGIIKAGQTARKENKDIKAVWRGVKESYVQPILDELVPGAKMETCTKANGEIIAIHPPRPYSQYLERLFSYAVACSNMSVDFVKVEVTYIDHTEFKCYVYFDQSYACGNYYDDTEKEVKICFCEEPDGWVPLMGNTTVIRN